MSERPIPLLGDISLELVQTIEHDLDGGFASLPIAGLDGELQQRTSRPSHRIRIAGVLAGDGAADQLAKLQIAAANGEELTFAANIVSALALQKIVITGFRAAEAAGRPDRLGYELELAESPPLPPPAVLEGFGGLDDFGLGDLGFDPGALGNVLGDLEDLAGEVAGAVDAVLDAVEALEALSNLDGLSADGLLGPITGAVGKFGDAGKGFGGALTTLKDAFG
jgi:hypothetical protein